MSGAGYTAGPWVAVGKVKDVAGPDNRDRYQLYIGDVNPDGGYRGNICSIQSCDHIANGISREEAAANAKLIAAAPDLLAALEAQANWLDEMAKYLANALPGYAGTIETHISKANVLRAAIAKASAP